MEKRHRIFIAINLPNDIKRELTKYQEEIQSRFTLSPDERGEWAKWTTKDNLHITLEFLGDLTDQEIGDACQIVSEVAKKHNLFSINLNKIICGPKDKMPPKMVWAMGEASNEMANLRNELQEYLLEKINFRPEGFGFTPHITLARISEWEFRKFEPEERPEIDENIDLVFEAESIEVMESQLKKGGPVYTILESHNLGE